MKFPFIFTAVAMAGALLSNSARADDAADLQQVIDLAAKNSDPETAAQVAASVKENQSAINALFKMYRSYLEQAGAAADSEKAAPAVINPDSTPAAREAEKTETLVAAPAATPIKTGGLQLGSLQTGHLEGAHLSSYPGAHLSSYPALPDVAPTASILQPTAAQVANKQQQDEAQRQRKLFFMEHPSRYYP